MYFSIAELWFPGENTGIMLPGAASSCPQQKTWEYLPEGCVAFSLQLSSYHCTHTPTWFLAHLLFGGHTTQHRLISCMMPSGLSLTQWGKCAMVYTSSHKKIPQEKSPCSLRWNQLIDSTSCRARKGTHPILLAK